MIYRIDLAIHQHIRLRVVLRDVARADIDDGGARMHRTGGVGDPHRIADDRNELILGANHHEGVTAEVCDLWLGHEVQVRAIVFGGEC